MANPLTERERRGLHALLVAAIAVGVAGYFTGTRGSPERGGYRPPSADSVTASVEAPRQKNMEGARYAERAVQQQLALAELAKPPRGVNDPVLRDAQAYALAVTRRSVGRAAYDGAPPTIPHAVDQSGAPACLACHEAGMRVEQKLASAMGHQTFTNCLQCHTTRDAALPVSQLLVHSVSESSSFVGMTSAGPGSRAWLGAPPQMPHRSFMRERCVSCHGVWADGLKSTHPYRQSCNQCHAPPSTSDQMPRSTFAPLGFSPEP